MNTVIIAASGSSRIHGLHLGVERALEHKLDVWLALTHQATRMVDSDYFQQLTDNQMVAGEWPPGDSPFPDERAVLFAPATFNSVTKLALGIADSPATSVAAKALGAHQRLVVAPAMDEGLAAHPKLAGYKQDLEHMGAVLFEGPAEADDAAWWAAVMATFIGNSA